MENETKKKKTGLRVVLIVIGVLAVIGFISSLGGQTSDSEAAGRTREVAPEQEKTWTELIRLTGSGDKKSQAFTYSGGKARLRYDFQADDFGAFVLYVVKDGKDIMQTGGFPEVMLQNGETGESNLSHLRKGDYYLNVTSANGRWEVVVEELK